MSKIQKITAYKVINSRGDWTLRTRVELADGSVGIQTIPDGASKGENEAVYIPIDAALDVVNRKLNKLLKGQDPFDQAKIDGLMKTLDNTEYKSNLGGNSIISVSLAVSKAAAASKKLELYEYIAELYGTKLKKDSIHFPTPLFNILNGGKHAHNGLSFQEFMMIPSKKFTFPKACEIGVDVYHILKKSLSEQGFDVDVGDEGGFAPTGFTADKALTFIRNAVNSKYKSGDDVFFGMDVAAGSFYDNNRYNISEENLNLDGTVLSSYYEKLLNKFEIIYIEDPFYEKDYASWRAFNAKFSNRFMVTGDDLVVTNPTILRNAIAEKYCNAVIVKFNQVGTLSETLEFIKLAREAGMAIIVSHRSGETAEDTFIADLALGVGADFIKSGAPARGERVVKYNRLLELYNQLNS